MHSEGLGTPRVDMAVEWLRRFNPRLQVTAVPSNITESNVRDLVSEADLVADCAPLFQERYLLNRECVLQRKPMVECAVHELEFHLTVIVPGETPCLRCLYPELSTDWTRRFPVFGAVSGTAGALSAMEIVKVLAGFGTPLKGTLLRMDLRDHQVTKLRIRRLPNCPDCGAL
jgi:molybdopterin/thiamine biosynthesis adenylyltransferase